MLGIAGELSVFISACLYGNLICLVYCVLRVFRRIIKHTLLWVSIEDLLFWIFLAFCLFAEMYRTCGGNIRWYFVLGVIAGGFVTGWILQKLMKKVVDKTEKTR